MFDLNYLFPEGIYVTSLDTAEDKIKILIDLPHRGRPEILHMLFEQMGTQEWDFHPTSKRI